jgi:hypothetical protein
MYTSLGIHCCVRWPITLLIPYCFNKPAVTEDRSLGGRDARWRYRATCSSASISSLPINYMFLVCLRHQMVCRPLADRDSPTRLGRSIKMDLYLYINLKFNGSNTLFLSWGDRAVARYGPQDGPPVLSSKP